MDVGGGGTITGSMSQARLPSETVSVTMSPSVTPSVVSSPLAVVDEGTTSVGFESTATVTSAARDGPSAVEHDDQMWRHGRTRIGIDLPERDDVRPYLHMAREGPRVVVTVGPDRPRERRGPDDRDCEACQRSPDHPRTVVGPGHSFNRS